MRPDHSGELLSLRPATSVTPPPDRKVSIVARVQPGEVTSSLDGASHKCRGFQLIPRMVAAAAFEMSRTPGRIAVFTCRSV